MSIRHVYYNFLAVETVSVSKKFKTETVTNHAI